MPRYEYTTFRAGVSDYDDKGVSGAFKFGYNLDIRKQVDSLTCAQALVDEGLDSSASESASPSPSSSPSASPSVSISASPSATPSPSASQSPSSSLSLSPSATPSSSISSSPSPSDGLTTVFRDLIRFFVKATDGYTYGFGSTGYVYRRDADAFWQIVYKDPNGAIKGAMEKPSETGKTYLLFATDTVLSRKELPGASDWNDVEVVGNASLNSADWHTMKQINGSAMIANGSWLALVGYDDSYTNEALDLIPGNLAKTLVERNGRLIIGTARQTDPTKSVNASIDTEFPLSQVGDDGQLHFANMSETLPIKRFPGGGKCNPDGVINEIEEINFFEWQENALSWIDKQTVGSMALFAMYDCDTGRGGIYSYGRKNKNHPVAMNLDYQLDADELGSLTSIDGTILVSYRDGTDFGVKAVDPTTKAEAVYEGLDIRSKNEKPDEITNWKYSEIYFEPFPDGASLEFWYKLDKTGSWIQSYMDDGTTSFTASGETRAVFFIQDKAEIFEPRLVITPTANISPEINMIKVFFE